MVILKEKICLKCTKVRKFIEGTPRYEQSICGNCWNWTDEDIEENRERFKYLLDIE